MDRSHRWKKIVEDHSHWTGDKKCNHSGHGSGAVAQKLPRINQPDDHWQPDVKNGSRSLEPWPQRVSLPDQKRDLHPQTGVKREQIKIEHSGVGLLRPSKQNRAAPIGRHKKQRRYKRQRHALLLCAPRPDRPQPKYRKAANPEKRSNPRQARPEMQETEIDERK